MSGGEVQGSVGHLGVEVYAGVLCQIQTFLAYQRKDHLQVSGQPGLRGLESAAEEWLSSEYGSRQGAL